MLRSDHARGLKRSIREVNVVVVGDMRRHNIDKVWKYFRQKSHGGFVAGKVLWFHVYIVSLYYECFDQTADHNNVRSKELFYLVAKNTTCTFLILKG